MDNKVVKKVAAVVIGAALVGGAFALGGALKAPVQVPGPVEYKTVTVEVPKEVVKEVKVEVPVEKIVTVEDESFKTMACDRLHYDIVTECVQEVKAEDAAVKIAVSAIENDFAQELKDADLVAKSKYAELVKVYDSFEDLEVTESDYDSGDYEFVIKAKVKDTNEESKFNVLFTVEVQDGESKITDVELI